MSEQENAPKRGRKPAASAEDLESLKARNERLEAQLRDLMTALAVKGLSAQEKTEEVEEPTYKVENMSGVMLHLLIVDPATLHTREIRLERRGEYAMLTAGQIERLKEKSPHYFSAGHLSAPALLSDSPNVIRDIAAFVASIQVSEMVERLAAITALGPLYQIYDYIETIRFSSTNADGSPVMEKDEKGNLRPSIREVPLDARVLALELAVQRRIADLSGVRVVL